MCWFLQGNFLFCCPYPQRGQSCQSLLHILLLMRVDEQVSSNSNKPRRVATDISTHECLERCSGCKMCNTKSPMWIGCLGRGSADMADYTCCLRSYLELKRKFTGCREAVTRRLSSSVYRWLTLNDACCCLATRGCCCAVNEPPVSPSRFR